MLLSEGQFTEAQLISACHCAIRVENERAVQLLVNRGVRGEMPDRVGRYPHDNCIADRRGTLGVVLYSPEEEAQRRTRFQLNLTTNQIEDVGPLAGLANLMELSLSGNDVTSLTDTWS